MEIGPNTARILILVFLFIRIGLSSLHIENHGFLPPQSGDMAITFYADVINDGTESSTNRLQMIKCCENKHESEVDCNLKLFSGSGVVIHPKSSERLFLFLLTREVHGRKGFCQLKLLTWPWKLREYDGMQNNQIETPKIATTYNMSFDTYGTYNVWEKVKAKFGYADSASCSSPNENPFNDCAPEKCMIDYEGRKSYFNRTNRRCEPMPPCYGSTKMVSPITNKCREVYEYEKLVNSFTTEMQTMSPIVQAELEGDGEPDDDFAVVYSESNEETGFFPRLVDKLRKEFEPLKAPFKSKASTMFPYDMKVECINGKKQGNTCVCDPGWMSTSFDQESYAPHLSSKVYKLCDVRTEEGKQIDKENRLRVTKQILYALLKALLAALILFLLWILCWRSNDKKDYEPLNRSWSSCSDILQDIRKRRENIPLKKVESSPIGSVNSGPNHFPKMPLSTSYSSISSSENSQGKLKRLYSKSNIPQTSSQTSLRFSKPENKSNDRNSLMEFLKDNDENTLYEKVSVKEKSPLLTLETLWFNKQEKTDENYNVETKVSAETNNRKQPNNSSLSALLNLPNFMEIESSSSKVSLSENKQKWKEYLENWQPLSLPDPAIVRSSAEGSQQSISTTPKPSHSKCNSSKKSEGLEEVQQPSLLSIATEEGRMIDVDKLLSMNELERRGSEGEILKPHLVSKSLSANEVIHNAPEVVDRLTLVREREEANACSNTSVWSVRTLPLVENEWLLSETDPGETDSESITESLTDIMQIPADGVSQAHQEPSKNNHLRSPAHPGFSSIPRAAGNFRKDSRHSPAVRKLEKYINWAKTDTIINPIPTFNQNASHNTKKKFARKNNNSNLQTPNWARTTDGARSYKNLASVAPPAGQFWVSQALRTTNPAETTEGR